MTLERFDWAHSEIIYLLYVMRSEKPYTNPEILRYRYHLIEKAITSMKKKIVLKA